MSDEQAIANLIYLYAERIDLGDFEGVGDLYAHAGVTAEPGEAGETRGAAAVTDMYKTWTRRYPSATSPTGWTLHTKHVTTNMQIHIDAGGTTASTKSYFTVFMQTDTLPLQPIISGRYHDQFEKVDGAWRWAHRHIITDLQGNLSEHLNLAIG